MREMSVTEQRYKAVQAVLAEGRTVGGVACAALNCGPHLVMATAGLYRHQAPPAACRKAPRSPLRRRAVHPSIRRATAGRAACPDNAASGADGNVAPRSRS